MNERVTRLLVGITGSTGAILGIRLLEVLGRRQEIEVHSIVSAAARKTIEYETGMSIDDVKGLAGKSYDAQDIAAPPASGTFPLDGMVIAPCSMKTLSAVANSYADDLIARAADVTLKERRKLVLVTRETPLHLRHLELMVDATRAGAVILPPVTAFYHRPKTIDDIVNHTITKVLDQFAIEAGLIERWSGA